MVAGVAKSGTDMTGCVSNITNADKNYSQRLIPANRCNTLTRKLSYGTYSRD